jgi:hypothetical protein
MYYSAGPRRVYCEFIHKPFAAQFASTLHFRGAMVRCTARAVTLTPPRTLGYLPSMSLVSTRHHHAHHHHGPTGWGDTRVHG